jgi:uroporphyrinogen-III synthase
LGVVDSAQGFNPAFSRDQPLTGARVLVTRPTSDTGGLVTALREAGAIPIELPTIRIEEVADLGPLDAAIDRLRAGDYDWVVFTSRNAVTRTLKRLEERDPGGAPLAGVAIAAVGEATAAALVEAGVALDALPERPDAEGVVATLAERGIDGKRVFFPKGDIARPVIEEGLRAQGAVVDAVDVYRTLPAHGVPSDAAAAIESRRIDAVLLMSPSSVHGLVALLGDRLPLLGDATVACVGPTTAAAAGAAGLRVDVVPEQPTITRLIAALARCPRLRRATDAAGDRERSGVDRLTGGT